MRFATMAGRRVLAASCRTGAGALAALAWLAVAIPAPSVSAQDAQGFRRFVSELWPEVQTYGVSRATFDKAFAGVEPDFSIPDLMLPGKADDKGQAEFTRTPAAYVNAAYLAKLSDQGKALLVKHRDALDRIERELGVQRQFVLAIWGRETAFGAHRSPHYAIQVLATQAYAGRRKDMFRNELIHALKLLEDGILTRETMKSSWAGAMGLTQFMPSEYYGLAYDLDRDGRKDIWTSVPDALASAANQLRYRGWVPGQTWAYEVRLPADVTCRAEGPPEARAVRDWVKRGVTRTGGQPFPAGALDAQAFVLTAGGAYGPAFLALENFMVIKRYNMSDLYAMFVGNLADRIAGGGNFDTPWGEVRQLGARGIEEIQRRLQDRGYAIAKIDGKAGMNTRALIGAYQHASRLKVDCWPSEALLAHLRAGAAADRAQPASSKGALGAR
ncbi:MAG: lytic murein transglycosylase [Hyphomonadaceae bacterium]|nr:lytic murein transglycosylase [Hyphomonadaceae bacterium]